MRELTDADWANIDAAVDRAPKLNDAQLNVIATRLGLVPVIRTVDKP